MSTVYGFQPLEREKERVWTPQGFQGYSFKNGILISLGNVSVMSLVKKIISATKAFNKKVFATKKFYSLQL